MPENPRYVKSRGLRVHGFEFTRFGRTFYFGWVRLSPLRVKIVCGAAKREKVVIPDVHAR